MQNKREGRPTRVRGVKDLGHGLYLIRARGIDPEGRRVERERRVQAGSVREALARKIELEEELGQLATPTQIEAQQRTTPEPPASAPPRRLGTVAEEWLEHRRSMTRRDGTPRLTPATRERYRQTVSDLIVPFLGKKTMDELSRQLIEKWRDHLGAHFASATVNGAMRVLRAILRDTDCRAADGVRTLEEDDTRLTDDAPNLLEDEGQIARFLELIKKEEPEHFALIGLLVTTGLRISTALALRREDFDPEKEIIVARRRLSAQELVEGMKRSRTARDVVPLVDWVWEAMQAEWASHNEKQRASGLAFATKAGTHRARTVLIKPLKAATHALGIPRLTPHGLRRTAALLYRLRRGSAVSKAIAGHLTDDMHLHYAPVLSSERAEAGRAVFGGLSAKKGGSKGGKRGDDEHGPPTGRTASA